jgi:DNA modification methylase
MTVRIIEGDCREMLATLPAESVHCCVTSPPYFGLRDYGVAGQIGLEPSPDEFIAALVVVFREVRRVLRSDGTLWLNLGDSYTTGASTAARSSDPKAVGDVAAGVRRIGTPAGLKPKDLLMIPARVALALQADGWWLRSDIIWHKPNPMPESVTDRPTSAHEHVFLLSKSARYFYDIEAVREPSVSDHVSGNGYGRPEQLSRGGRGQAEGWTDVGGLRNLRNVWTIATAPFSEAHFATFPPALVEPCIRAGCPAGGTVLDPFGGAGTVGLVADRLQRDAILVELNPAYAAMARNRIANDGGMFAQVAE